MDGDETAANGSGSFWTTGTTGGGDGEGEVTADADTVEGVIIAGVWMRAGASTNAGGLMNAGGSTRGGDAAGTSGTAGAPDGGGVDRLKGKAFTSWSTADCVNGSSILKAWVRAGGAASERGGGTGWTVDPVCGFGQGAPGTKLDASNGFAASVPANGVTATR